MQFLINVVCFIGLGAKFPYHLKDNAFYKKYLRLIFFLNRNAHAGLPFQEIKNFKTQ